MLYKHETWPELKTTSFQHDICRETHWSSFPRSYRFRSVRLVSPVGVSPFTSSSPLPYHGTFWISGCAPHLKGKPDYQKRGQPSTERFPMKLITGWSCESLAIIAGYNAWRTDAEIGLVGVYNSHEIGSHRKGDVHASKFKNMRRKEEKELRRGCTELSRWMPWSKTSGTSWRPCPWGLSLSRSRALIAVLCLFWILLLGPQTKI